MNPGLHRIKSAPHRGKLRQVLWRYRHASCNELAILISALALPTAVVAQETDQTVYYDTYRHTTPPPYAYGDAWKKQ
jgi:hypothetical protein